MRGNAVDPEIDRHWVPEIAQVRQADRGQLRAIHLPGGGKRGEIAVGEGQDNNVARALPKVDGLDNLVETGGTGRKQMHRLPGC
jgi:hypothetical protein